MPLQLRNDQILVNGYTAKIIRTSRRKTASIKVSEGKVSIIVPESLSTDKIESLLAKKSRWIKDKLTLHEDTATLKTNEFVSGEAFSYLGRNYRLKVVKGLYPSITFHQGRFVASVMNLTVNNQPAIKQLLIRWYKQHAEAKLIEKTQRYAKILGLSPSSVGIKTYQSRWGGCSQSGEIYYNWKIIMAPNCIVDYVVIHELCHIKHHNHSQVFWALLESYCPDYSDSKEWLKLNGNRLDI